MRPIPLAGVALLLAAPIATAANTSYDRVAYSEPASAGLEVQPPLDEFKAVSAARVIVPRQWQRLPVKGGKPQYLTAGGTCRFRVTWSVRSRIDDSGDATEHLDKAIAAPPKAHVYEQGERNGHPFRVVKIAGSPNDVIRGTWVAVLTRRKDIAPAGKVVWTEVTANARSRSGDECHSGTVHNAARYIADGLSVATVVLRFVKG